MKVLKGLQGFGQDAAFDLVVVGAGGAGMAAALFAAMEGASVLLVERTDCVGGTTAWSAGTSWLPGSKHAAKVNPGDTLAETARYLDNAVGERTSKAVRQAFLDNGRVAVDEVESRSELKYRPYPKHPDYISDLGGSTLNGRALEPMPFDARWLGRELFALTHTAHANDHAGGVLGRCGIEGCGAFGAKHLRAAVATLRDLDVLLDRALQLEVLHARGHHRTKWRPRQGLAIGAVTGHDALGVDQGGEAHLAAVAGAVDVHAHGKAPSMGMG